MSETFPRYYYHFGNKEMRQSDGGPFMRYDDYYLINKRKDKRIKELEEALENKIKCQWGEQLKALNKLKE